MQDLAVFQSLKALDLILCSVSTWQDGGAANQGDLPEIPSGILSGSRLEFAKTQ